MRRLIAVPALLATGVALIATGATPSDCAAETVTLQAMTTCGPAGPVELTSRADCLITAKGGPAAGLPEFGQLTRRFPDAGVRDGFVLEGYDADAGQTTCATVLRATGAIAIQCGSNCWTRATADGGAEGDCSSTCEGNLNP